MYIQGDSPCALFAIPSYRQTKRLVLYTEVIWFSLRQSVNLRTFLFPYSLLLAAVCGGTNSSLVALPMLWKIGCMISHFPRSVHSVKTFWHLVMLIIYHFEKLRREQQGLHLNFLDEEVIRSWLNGKLSTLSWNMLCLVVFGVGLKF